MQPTSCLAGRRNPCSRGVNRMSHPGRVIAALMYLTQVFTEDQTLVTDSNVIKHCQRRWGWWILQKRQVSSDDLMLKIHSMLNLNCAITSWPSKHAAKLLVLELGFAGFFFLLFPKGLEWGEWQEDSFVCECDANFVAGKLSWLPTVWIVKLAASLSLHFD